MAHSYRSNQVTVLMLGVTLALVGGTAAVAGRESSHREASGRVPASAPDRASRSVAALPDAAAPFVAAPKADATTGLPGLVYVVRPGDTLSAVAAWFTREGYGSIFAANRAVIGDDPNLIRPGERIVIADGVMSSQTPA